MMFEKPSRSQRKRDVVQRRKTLAREEREHKLFSKQRDHYRCRFPLCGCARFGFHLESAHLDHKGMGGDPTGERSWTGGLITLCYHRHRLGRFSLHAGTVRVVFLSDEGANGLVRWEIDRTAMPGWPADAVVTNALRWRVLGEELSRGRGFQAHDDWALDVLAELSSMEL